MNNSNPKRISIFGPQGSGKGTQSDRISAAFGIPHIAPGNIFRKAIADKTELGKKVEDIINAGNLVPNEITNALMKARIEEEDAQQGFIFDGYPRNESQADALDAMTQLTCVIVLEIPDDEAVRRLSQRRMCMNCGATYHLEFNPPKVAGICDSCGKAVIQRDDDKPEAIRQRLGIYHSTTEPLFERYEQRGILCRVNGVGTIEEVGQRIEACF